MRCRNCNCEALEGERFCFNCGSPLEEEEPRKPKKLWILWVCAALALVLLGLYTIHIWEDATCTEPETCMICRKTRGEELGHSWWKATCTEPKTCAVCGETKGSPEGHSWKDATCSEPKTCSVCKTTDGETLPHTWVSATCTEPMYCSVCGSITGSALGHDWMDATYEDPQTCAACGLQEGERLGELGYVGGEWADSPVDFGTWSIYPLVLDQTIYNCDLFLLYVKFDEYTQDGDWEIHIKTTDGKWTKLGEMIISGVETWWGYDLSSGGTKPVSFTEIALVPVDAPFDSFGIYFDLERVHVTG